jgi:hypothetical protein
MHSLRAVLMTVLFLPICASAATGHALVQSSNEDAAQRCESLMTQDFSTILDAPTQLSEARHIVRADDLLPVDGTGFTDELRATLRKSLGTIKPQCRVTGYVRPNVGFQLLLPDAGWNGRFLHLGCGGWCGNAQFGAFCALYPGYACIGTDMGHTGKGGLWFRDNLQGQIDFAYRATHVVTLAGKWIVAQFYGHTPKHSYFVGCSTGGYQGMVEAQRFPWDFQGIVAGAPDMDQADLAVRGLWLKSHFVGNDQEPLFKKEDLNLLHKAVLARCDGDDGVKDGIVGDPVHCTFDPEELACKAGNVAQCLTPKQVAAAKAIYGMPVTSFGEVLSTRGVLPGSELNWMDALSSVWGESFFHDTAILTVPGREWTYRDFDFDRDYPRSGVGVLFPDTDPDLRRFKGAGGKLISYQGGDDASEIPGAIVDYYETVERTMGGRAETQNFFRFFVIPGMDHCGGGKGAFAVDYLHYLEGWVEKGDAPDSMVAAHVPGLGKNGWAFLKFPLDEQVPISFTRPVYPYPSFAKFTGRGSPNSAENFEPVQR